LVRDWGLSTKRIRPNIGYAPPGVAAPTTGGCVKGADDAPAASGTVSSGTQSAAKDRYDTLVIPSGTGVVASLDTSLSTDVNHSGDAFTATTVEPITVGGRTVMPSGSKIHGALQNVEDSGRIKGRAKMTLVYQAIVDPQGKRYGISAAPLTLQAASATHGDIEKIAAGTVLGAIVGGIADGGKGAAIGAGVGAGAGTIVMLATKGDDLELSPGQKLSVVTTGATSVQVAAR
jgi:hypothetical protein